MNREILFRGKRVDNGEWVEGCYYESRISGCFILVPKLKARKKDGVIIGDSFDVYEVSPETVGQYTGLTDKNDKKIFDGNIIKFTTWDCQGSDTQHIGVVKLAYGMWSIWKSSNSEYWGADGAFELYMVHSGDDEIEVISNIHDNPELLEVQDE